MIRWSRHWKSSTSARKQRNYLEKAPIHVRRNFVGAHLSKELQKKHGRRSASVRAGDKVSIMRGQFRKRTGKVDSVDIKNSLVYINGIETVKKDGSKALYPINPSNLLVTELISDKRRFKKSEEKKE